MLKSRVGVLGATSLVGALLLPLLSKMDWEVVAFSRQHKRDNSCAGQELIKWVDLQEAQRIDSVPSESEINHWVCVAPIWVLPDYFSMLRAYGAQRVVVLSSTSRFSKDDSSDLAEQALAQRLAEAEAGFIAWAEKHSVSWVILRPTLIYGLGRDQNISVIARVIARFGFFPLLGAARGLRQPVHAADVAWASMAALMRPLAANGAYSLSGGETLPYREMVGRVFHWLDRPARFINVPLWMFRMAVMVLRILPRYRHWSAAMAERMNQDLVFDHADATRDFDFSPRAFVLDKKEMTGE